MIWTDICVQCKDTNITTIYKTAFTTELIFNLLCSVWVCCITFEHVSPCPLVVKEEHQVEPLVHLLLPLLPQVEDVFGWDRDGHPVVQQALLGHLWVDDLERTHSQSNRKFRFVSSTVLSHRCSMVPEDSCFLCLLDLVIIGN